MLICRTSAKGLHFPFGRDFELPSTKSTKQQVNALQSPPFYLTGINNSCNSYKKISESKSVLKFASICVLQASVKQLKKYRPIQAETAQLWGF